MLEFKVIQELRPNIEIQKELINRLISFIEITRTEFILPYKFIYMVIPNSIKAN